VFEFFGGIDFSGAREPLGNLWTAVGHERDGKLHVVALCPHPYRADLGAYVAGGWRAQLGAAGQARILWGADFPFGLPIEATRRLLSDAPEAAWDRLLDWVADRPPDEVRGAVPDLQRSLRRTDAAGALPPLDLRLYKQTVEGLRWLHELREAEETAVVPQSPRDGAATTLIEVYPSATMKDLGIRCRRVPSRPGEVRARPAALRTFLTFADPSLEAIAVTLEDAWDATFACLTAWLCREDLDQPHRSGGAERELLELEGWIYSPPGAERRAAGTRKPST
jgi:hypothetical protein